MNPQSTIKPIGFFRTLCQFAFLVLLALAAAVGAGAAVYYYLPPQKCVAYGVFQIKVAPESMLSPVKGHDVLNAAVSRPEVKDCSIIRNQNDPIQWLQSQLQVDFEKKETGLELMKVSMEGNNPDELKTIIKAVTESYRKEIQGPDLPPQKKCVAYAIFQIKAQPDFIIQAAGDAKIEFNLYRQIQAALLKSRLVLNAAVSQPEMKTLPQVRNAADSINWLADQLKVDFLLGPELMRISIEGDNPDELKTIITAVANAYLKEVVNKDKARRMAAFDQITKIQLGYEDKLKNNRKSMKALAERLATSEPSVAALREKDLQDEIASFRRDLSQVERDLLKAKSEAETIQKAIKESVDGIVVSKEMIDAALLADPPYQKLLEKKHALAMAIDQLKNTLPAPNPNLAGKEKDLNLVNDEMAAYRAKTALAVKASAHDKLVSERTKKLNDLKERIGISINYKETLEKKLSTLTDEIRNFKKDQVDVEDIKAQTAQTEKIRDKLQSEIESMKPELGAISRVSIWEDPIAVALGKPFPLQGPSQRISVWEEPTAVVLPEESRKLKWGSIAAFATFAVGMGLIFTFGCFYRRVVYVPIAGERT